MSLSKPLWLFAAVASMSVMAVSAQASVLRAGPTLARPVTVGPQSSYQVQNNASCKSRGGVSVSPCPVTVGSTNPEQMVTVTAPNGSTVTEKDTCSAKNIATVVGSGTTYEVVAGTAAGKCKAKFTAKDSKGNKVGRATLNITNTGL